MIDFSDAPQMGGTAEQQIVALRAQMQQMQEETEDAIRTLRRQIEAIMTRLEA